MTIALLVGTRADGAREHERRVYDALCALNVPVLRPPLDTHEEITAALQKADIVVALGGDGTIIHAAKHAAAFQKPVLGINAGHLGFMAGLEADELDKLPALLSGAYQIERRMLLDIRTGERRLTALNEAVVSRGALSQMVELRVDNHGEPVVSYRADGVIIATPTGSTAYALSAGGPIIDPALSVLSMTPICPHSLYSRSYIFSDSAQLTLRAAAPSLTLCADGEVSEVIAGDSVIVFSRASYDAQLIKIKPTPFYRVLSDKLMRR